MIIEIADHWLAGDHRDKFQGFSRHFEVKVKNYN